MRFTAYNSKIWWLAMLGLIALFAWGISFVWSRLPLAFQIIFTGLLLLAALGTLFPLFSSQPRLVIDETGISCYRPFYATLPWEAVLSAERAPRIEKWTDTKGTHHHFHFSDAWRPIDLRVKNLNTHSALLPPPLHAVLARHLRTTSDPDVYRLRLDLTGMAGSSADALETIRYHLARKACPEASKTSGKGIPLDPTS